MWYGWCLGKLPCASGRTVRRRLVRSPYAQYGGPGEVGVSLACVGRPQLQLVWLLCQSCGRRCVRGAPSHY